MSDQLYLPVQNETWVFDWTKEQPMPILPMLAIGVANNEDYPWPDLMYAVDTNYNIWIGNKQDYMTLGYGDQHSAMTLLFDFNIVSWAKVCYLLGNDRVQAIIEGALSA